MFLKTVTIKTFLTAFIFYCLLILFEAVKHETLKEDRICSFGIFGVCPEFLVVDIASYAFTTGISRDREAEQTRSNNKTDATDCRRRTGPVRDQHSATVRPGIL